MRTNLANERTLLAYIRTSLTAFIFGLGVIEFVEPNLKFVGLIFIFISFIVLILGFYHFIRRHYNLK